jgi:RNA polymerase sigma-70 factor (family 1)
MLTCPDDLLLNEMANDNREAFTSLYRRYWEELFITAVKALRGKEEAADVVQDVFLSLWNRRNELNIQGSIAAYLHTSVRYKCIHYIEKNITRRDYLVQLADVEVSNSSTNAEIDLQLKEIQQTVSKTVAKMPPKMQEVYKLSRQEHLTYREIAERMGTSSETVKKHIQGALRLIRTNLTSHSFSLFLLVCFWPH